MPEPVGMKLGTHSVATEPICTAHCITPLYQSAWVSMCIPVMLFGSRYVKTLLRQQIYTLQHKSLDASFSIKSVSYQRKMEIFSSRVRINEELLKRKMAAPV
jgi:hypothetical protein